jgi:hypothetical protein
MSKKDIMELSVLVLGEMMRSESYDLVSPGDMSYQAVDFAIGIAKETNEQFNEFPKLKTPQEIITKTKQ